MLTLDKCCCGCSLRTGSIIIAIFYFALSGVATGWFASHINKQKGTAMQVVQIIMGVMYAIQFVANILLLVAIFGKKCVLIIPWLVVHIVKCAVASLGYLVIAILNFISAEGPFVVLGVTGLLVMILGLGLQTYFILVVYSLYKEMKEIE